jgi:hypothetical protein
LRYAHRDTSYFGRTKGERADRKTVKDLKKALIKAKSKIEKLSSESRYHYLRNIREAQIDTNLDDPFNAISVLISACEIFESESLGLEKIGFRPSKANLKEVAIIHTCRRVWELITENEAPRYVTTASDLGGDASRRPSPFDLFCRDVFKAHECDPRKVSSALDAWRSIMSEPIFPSDSAS